MSYVGLDLAKCSDLKAHLDQAAADLNAHAATVQGLLAQADIQSCRAPAELRDVAAWAAYRARDLHKRIDRARAREIRSVRLLCDFFHPGLASENFIAYCSRYLSMLTTRYLDSLSITAASFSICTGSGTM